MDTGRLGTRARSGSDGAVARLTALLRQARHLVDDVTVPEGDAPEVPLDGLREAVAALRDVPGEPADLAAHLTARYPAVVATARAVRAYAEGFLRQRDTGWRRAAAELRGWVDAAAPVPQWEATLAGLKAARSWVKTTVAQLRNERLAPFAAHSQRIWAQLRQESNVELGAMTLEGSNTRRRVVFPVSVDGADNGTAGSARRLRGPDRSTAPEPPRGARHRHRPVAGSPRPPARRGPAAGRS